MSLTEDEDEKLQHMLGLLEENIKLLSEWEQGFIRDQIKRYEEYRANIRVSPKQWAVINRIYKEKIENVEH